MLSSKLLSKVLGSICTFSALPRFGIWLRLSSSQRPRSTPYLSASTNISYITPVNLQLLILGRLTCTTIVVLDHAAEPAGSSLKHPILNRGPSSQIITPAKPHLPCFLKHTFLNWMNTL